MKSVERATWNKSAARSGNMYSCTGKRIDVDVSKRGFLLYAQNLGIFACIVPNDVQLDFRPIIYLVKDVFSHNPGPILVTRLDVKSI